MSPCVSTAICAAAGTAAVVKCVAPAGATHEQVDVAAAAPRPRAAGALMARRRRVQKNKTNKTKQKTRVREKNNNAGEPCRPGARS